MAEFRTLALEGEPSDRALARVAGVSPTTVGTWLRGGAFPQQIDPVITIVEAVRAHAHRTGRAGKATGLWDLQRWREAHFAEAQRRAGATGQAVQAAQAQAVVEAARPGTPLEQVTDPFAVEVHRPITVDGATTGLLPPYVRREHDERLDRVVARVLDGASAVTVLVAGSSAGKTRACWEALKPLRRAGGWRLWHPYDPTRPEAALQELDRVGPRTVVWLNETQDYLGGEAGERVAAKLRALLTDASRGPVLVLGTLWPEHHAALTGRPGSQVRQVLGGAVIGVPGTFTGIDLAALGQTASTDRRLAEAIEHAEDGHVTQYLAGGPELLERLATADPAAKAVMWAAMDARRLGHRNALPLPLLEQAAPAYLTDLQHDQLGEDWLEQALAYTSRPCKGARGPLTRIRPRPSRTAPSRRARDRHSNPDEDHGNVPVYRLADYLDQHARDTRADQIPPIGFWVAAAAHAHPGDQHTLGHAARARGLYRDAAQLHKNATTHGNPHAAAALVDHLHAVHPADHRPADYALAHLAFDDPGAVDRLLYRLREIGAQEQVAALADLIVAHAAIDDPDGVATFLDSLQRARVEEQVAALADRAAAHTALDDPGAVDRLLYRLREIGAQEQVAALADRVVAHAAIAGPGAVASLLDRLRLVGAQEQAVALADLIVAHAALDDPHEVAHLLRRLRWIGADEQVVALMGRDPAAHVALGDSDAVAHLLVGLWEIGAQEQVAALVARDPAAHVALENSAAITFMLSQLRTVGADGQVVALADRVLAHTAVDNPSAVASLLKGLWNVGAHGQIAALLARSPATHVALDDPIAIGFLLHMLQVVRADEQLVALADRAVAHTALDNPSAVPALLGRLWKAGAQGQAVALADRAAPRVAVNNPYSVADLLGQLWQIGAHEQMAALADRGLACTALHYPRSITDVLDRLRQISADGEVTVLVADRVAANLAVEDPDGVASVLGRLWKAGAQEQAVALADRAAPRVALDNPHHVADLLKRLQEIGAHKQAVALADRAAAHTALHDPIAVASLLGRFREIGAQGQIAALVAHDPAAHAAVDYPYGVDRLLEQLQEIGAHKQALALADRAAAHTALDNPHHVADLVERLREIGAQEQVAALADRVVAHAAIAGPGAVASLLDRLWLVGAREQAVALADRLPAVGMFAEFLQIADHRVRYRFGRTPDGRPAHRWGWENLE
ncbi:hypothetical protein [Actinomadura litoris]|uniref:Uncharacterized protein n=1 Tax=Actinomadura litoris TaxID=2678616 RepID=A0A7K1LBN6_9ACTN|nr:hypothetical protein [Actinomadura litoris]MUN41676.1 hypothetical protein [Actinomadura litoris]